jgi:hypothetical protein
MLYIKLSVSANHIQSSVCRIESEMDMLVPIKNGNNFQKKMVSLSKDGGSDDHRTISSFNSPAPEVWMAIMSWMTGRELRGS